MAAPTTRRPPASPRLPGSERPRPASHGHVRPLADNESVDFTLIVRRKPGAPPLPDMDHWHAIPIRERKFLTPYEYARTYGAQQSDIDAVEKHARANGLTVLRSHAGRRTVSLQGSADTGSETVQDRAAPLRRSDSTDRHRPPHRQKRPPHSPRLRWPGSAPHRTRRRRHRSLWPR